MSPEGSQLLQAPLQRHQGRGQRGQDGTREGWGLIAVTPGILRWLPSPPGGFAAPLSAAPPPREGSDGHRGDIRDATAACHRGSTSGHPHRPLSAPTFPSRPLQLPPLLLPKPCLPPRPLGTAQVTPEPRHGRAAGGFACLALAPASSSSSSSSPGARRGCSACSLGAMHQDVLCRGAAMLGLQNLPPAAPPAKVRPLSRASGASGDRISTPNLPTSSGGGL